MPETPSERSLHASIAGLTSWANTSDPTARTEEARRSFKESFEDRVDPDGTLEPAERTRRARHLYLAHMRRLALQSARARRLKAEERAELDGAA